MAYKQNWNPKDKLDKDDLVKELTMIAPMMTDGAFHIRFESDDGGTVVTIYGEDDMEGEFPSAWLEGTHHLIDTNKFRGWRIVRTTVPTGYINCFFKDEK